QGLVFRHLHALLVPRALSQALSLMGERLDVNDFIRWPRTPASIEGPQLAPRFTAPARMTAAPSSFSLPLLPSGPDGVRRPEVRRSRPSTPFAAARRENPDLSTGIRSG